MQSFECRSIMVYYLWTFSDFVFALGNYYYGSVRNTTELMDTTTWRWTEKASYPFEEVIYYAQSIYHNYSFYVFGGWDYNSSYHCLSRIASFHVTTNTWASRGQLGTRRYGAGVIWSDEVFLVVGGWMSGNTKTTEKCRFNDEDQIECQYQTPSQPYCKFP